MPTDYAALFHRLYDRAPAGIGREELRRAERRLGLVIPPPLRALYLELGGEACVMATHNRVRSPAELEVADGRLVFCEENQTVCVWGSIPGSEDPEAEVANVLRHGTLEWHSEEVSLSRFLEIMIYLQTAWGGFEHYANLEEPGHALPKIEAEWDQVVRHNGLTIYAQPGLLITALDGDPCLTAAARTRDGIARLERELGFRAI